MKQNLLFNQASAIGKRIAMVLTMLLIVGIGQVWGESIEITTTNSGVNGSYRDYEFDVSSITFGCTQWMKNNNIQAKKSTTNSFYNVDAIPGTITSIVVKQTGTARAIKIYGGTSSKPTTQITSPTTAAEMTFNFTGKNYTYFSLTTPGNACYFDKITINYTPSGGGGDTGDDNTGGGSDDGECRWELVTDASKLKEGDEIVIAAKDYNYALSTTQNNNNRGQASITKEGNTITWSSGVQIITLGSGVSYNGTFVFNTGLGYLYAAGANSNNYLRTNPNTIANGDWEIAITNNIAYITAQGTASRNMLRYNTSGLFSCYAEDNTQKDIVIYKKTCTTELTVCLIHENRCFYSLFF